MSAAAAGLIVMAASIWDGVAGLLIGVAADRRGARAFVRLYAVPLALAFVLLYIPLPIQGTGLIAFGLIANMLFRTFYVAVNVPYAALTIDIAPDSISRSRIAGLRMIFGGVAALLVATGTEASMDWAGQTRYPDWGYASVAVALAIVATVLLFAVGGMRMSAPVIRAKRADVRARDIVLTIVGNRAFLAINLGICGAAAAMGVITRAVPYYFKYQVGDVAAGSTALAGMAIAGVVAVPMWMAWAARFGHRAQWQASAAIAVAALTLLLSVRPTHALAAQILCALFYVGGQGLFFGFWALLPDVVQHGAPKGSPRMDVFLFGIAALLQKVAQGIAVAVFGTLLAASGYVARTVQPEGVLDRLVLLTALLPLIGMIIAWLAMLGFPRLRAMPR